MNDSTFGVDVGADRAVVAVQGSASWETIGVELEDLPHDLVSRVGDRQPCVRLVDGGGFRLRPAHEMYVDAVERSLAVAGARLYRPVEGPVGLAVPSWWTQRAASWTLGALTARGMENLRLVNAAEAAVAGARAAGVPVPAEVLVVDLGARSCSATVVSGHGRHPRAVPGANAVHLEGGDMLDRLVLHHVVASLDGLGVALERDDTADVAAASAYLEHCREARHDLSVRSAIAVTPALAGSEHRLRIVREEFEELVAGWRAEVVRIAVAAVDQSPRRPEAVLLSGGLSRTPLIGQTLSAALDLEVIVVPDPDLVVAFGAAEVMKGQDEPLSLWARSRARLSRGWLRRPASRAIQASGGTPLALPVGSTPVAAEESSGVLIEQVPNGPIALGPAEGWEQTAAPAPAEELTAEGAEPAADVAVEPAVEVVEPAVEVVEPAAAITAEAAEEPEAEPEPVAEAEPEPVAEAEPVDEAVDEQSARDEAVVDLIQAFVPSQRTSSEDRTSELAGLTLVGSNWVRVPGPVFGNPSEPAPDPVATSPEPPAVVDEGRPGRRRRRAGRRKLTAAEMTGLDELFDDTGIDERSGDRASSGAR